MKKIVIAADSFKGSVSSRRFAEIAGDAIKALLPDCEVVAVRLGDGGEGTTDALASALGGRIITAQAVDPLGRPLEASYMIADDGVTAILEMAAASGLPLLAESERNPWLTSTFGTGMMIADALRRGCRRLLIGIGGSATNDGGMGMLTALGARFFDKNNELIHSPGCGGDLDRVVRADFSELLPGIKGTAVTVACDVDNPFYGPRGAAEIFARQKGADDSMVERLDRGMKKFASVLAKATGRDISDLPGAGAAGGMGGALAAVLDGRLTPGVEMVLEALGFDSLVKDADLIITGEGKIDNQTLMGKAPAGVLAAGRHMGVPVVAVGGSVEYSQALCAAGFAAIFSIQPGPLTLTQALDPTTAERNLAHTIAQIVNFASVMKPNAPIMRKNS